jgi:uncharacterized protein YidB (DUF937 family)
MDLGAITQALGGLLGGQQQQQAPQPQSAPQQQAPQAGAQGGGFSISPAMLTALLPVVMQFINSKGGIQGVLGMFDKGGAASQAQSWVAEGENAQVSPEQVAAALGPDVDAIAQQAGVPPEEAASGIAAVLPKVIDTLTPGGNVPSAGDVSSIISSVLGKK